LTVTVKVYAGSSATGTPVRTMTTTRAPVGAWNVSAPTALGAGTYTVQAEQQDTAGNIGRSSANTFTIGSRPPVGTGAEFIGAGDIAYCDDTGDEATAALLDQFASATVFTLGDNAYESGTTQEFNNCYQPSWGRAKARTRPSLGDHDYADGANPNGTGYFAYFGTQLAPFGPSATDPNRGYYSYDLGAWHVVVLNAVCGGAASGCSVPTQITWLRSDLAAHPNSCTLALMSAPRFSSGSVHGNNTSMQTYWGELAQAGVEFVMSGDDHDYERFAAMNAAGQADPNGMRQWVVGSGGRSHYPFVPDGVVRANSEVREDATYGILRLVLRAGAYEWEFIPEAGKSFVDSGSGTCH
jgi:acid phosphatase type 7